jgi:type-F conjugative transfer system pilin assembly protein TrbC
MLSNRQLQFGAWVAVAALLAPSALAQTSPAPVPFPSMQEIERASRELVQRHGSAVAVPKATSSSALPARTQDTRSSAVAGSSSAVPTTSPGASSAVLPPPTDSNSQRLLALMRQYGMNESVPLAALRGRLYVAVSFSMPQEALRRVLQQTASAGGTLLLKGFHGSFERTREQLERMLEMPDISADIAAGRIPNLPTHAVDARAETSVQLAPQLFERFDIREVPTFVLLSPVATRDDCTDSQCKHYRDFVAVSGDVSLGHALEAIRRGSPRFATQAAYFAARAAAAEKGGKP